MLVVERYVPLLIIFVIFAEVLFRALTVDILVLYSNDSWWGHELLTLIVQVIDEVLGCLRHDQIAHDAVLLGEFIVGEICIVGFEDNAFSKLTLSNVAIDDNVIR